MPRKSLVFDIDLFIPQKINLLLHYVVRHSSGWFLRMENSNFFGNV